MTSVLRWICFQTVGFAALAASAAAQQSAPLGEWAILSQLAPGSEIRVKLATGADVRGFVQRVTLDSLEINSTTGQETLSRQQIRRVSMKRPGHRGRNTLIGLGIGAGAGLAVGAGLDAQAGKEWNLFPNAGKAVCTPLGALVGAVVGVALPSGGWRDLYRAP